MSRAFFKRPFVRHQAATQEPQDHAVDNVSPAVVPRRARSGHVSDWAMPCKQEGALRMVRNSRNGRGEPGVRRRGGGSRQNGQNEEDQQQCRNG